MLQDFANVFALGDCAKTYTDCGEMEMMSERYRREHDTEKFARRVCARNVLRYLDGQPLVDNCLLYTSPSPRDQRGSRMPSSA